MSAIRSDRPAGAAGKRWRAHKPPTEKPTQQDRQDKQDRWNGRGLPTQGRDAASRAGGGRARRQCGLLILFIRVSLHQFHDPIGVVATLADAVNDLRDPEVEYGIDNHA